MKLPELLRGALKSPNGTYDPMRILFAIGGLNGVIAPVGFEAWAMGVGQAWDPLAFCTAYGGMLAAVLTAGGLAMKTKDKGLADSLATLSDTNLKEVNNDTSIPSN